LVIVKVPLVVIGPPVTLIPVPPVAFTDVTEPEPLLLKVFQSVLLKYPLVVEVACEMLTVGVNPDVTEIGEVPETELT
jgi:hypothetical protein